MADRRDVAEVGILVADGVVAVGVGGDDRAELLRLGHRRQIVLREGFEEPFLADASHVVARGALALVEQAEVEAGGAEEPGDGARHVLVARVVGGVVADEPEMLAVSARMSLTGNSSAAVQPARLRGLSPKLLPRLAIMSRVSRSCGSMAPSSTSRRRICTIIVGCSIPTGQISMQAPQERHDQSVSASMTSPISAGPSAPPPA